MLRLSCPYCGPRDETEFAYGGESHISRPPPEVGGAEWANYLYFRRNVKGVAFERWQHAGFLQVIHDDLRARRQTGLHPRLGSQSARDRFLRQQPGGHQYRGIRRVGATGDRGDDHAAVLNGRSRSAPVA